MATSQSRAVLSSLAVAIFVPSGLNATAFTSRVMLQRLAERLARGRVPEPGRMVRLAVAIFVPSGLNATARHIAVMLERLAERLARGRVPEPDRVPSLAVAIFVPSGLNATAFTASSCLSGSPSGLPVAASQSRAVLRRLR